MNEQYLDTIHRYLNGTMDVNERESFETEMRQNPSLQKDVEMERLLLGGLEHAGETELRQKIGTVQDQLAAEGFFRAGAAETSPRLSVTHLSKTYQMKRIIAIAASFAILAAAVWFFTRPANTPDPGALFSKYYQPKEEIQRAQEIIPKLESGLAGIPTDGDTLRDALQFYADGNLEEAEKLLKIYLESSPEDLLAAYFLGATFMSQGYYAKAIEIFLPLSRGESPLKNDALWNLGLCYLKTENGMDDARVSFEKLSADNAYPNHRGAKAVLEQLLPQH
jgi:TolA-binding protein